jgi:hypothetical protein
VIALRQAKQGRQCTYKRIIEVRSSNHCCRGKATRITHSECVFEVFVTQYATRMRRITLSPAACLALPYFSTLSHKRHDFRMKCVENKMRVFIFYKNFLCLKRFSFLRRIQCDMIRNVHRSSCKVPVILVRYLCTVLHRDSTHGINTGYHGRGSPPCKTFIYIVLYTNIILISYII